MLDVRYRRNGYECVMRVYEVVYIQKFQCEDLQMRSFYKTYIVRSISMVNGRRLNSSCVTFIVFVHLHELFPVNRRS